MTFTTWIDTFTAEKGISMDHVLEVNGPMGANFMPVEVLIGAMKQAPAHEQQGIKKMLVKIDFVAPGAKPVLDYFAHLAQAIAI